MNVDYKDFIGVFSGVYPEGFCEHLIAEFERLQALGIGGDRQTGERISAPKYMKNDYFFSSNGKNIEFSSFEGQDTHQLFFKGLQDCFASYCDEFSTLKSVDIRCNNMKLQKTSKGGGYHVWHFEQGNNAEASRGLVYMLYLNTLPAEANGETEFLYQQRRINPVENTMLVWPAAFTHTHRGNAVYGDNFKYVVTGWFLHE